LCSDNAEKFVVCVIYFVFVDMLLFRQLITASMHQPNIHEGDLQSSKQLWLIFTDVLGSALFGGQTAWVFPE